MKKILFILALISDVIATGIFLKYFSSAESIMDRAVYGIYMAFFIFNLYERYRHYKLTNTMQADDLGRNTDKIYLVSLVFLYIFLALNLYFMTLGIDGVLGLFVVIAYLVGVFSYERNTMYFDNEKFIYGSKEIAKNGILKIFEENRRLSKVLTIKYKNGDETIFTSPLASELESIKEYVEKHTKYGKKNGKR